jgi:hypothetical protein
MSHGGFLLITIDLVTFALRLTLPVCFMISQTTHNVMITMADHDNYVILHNL